jgi:hypothetical protein
MKYWINDLPGNDKLIIWDEDKIYKSNPSQTKLRDYEYLLKKNEIPDGLFSIYLSSIRVIEMDESKIYICIYFGVDSYEHFRISNITLKKEIFNELSKIENANITVKELTLQEKTKAQKKAFIVLTILFVIGFLFSWIIEFGGLPEGRYPVILLFLGGLGMRNISMFYLIIILIIGLKFYLNRKAQRIIHRINLK